MPKARASAADLTARLVKALARHVRDAAADAGKSGPIGADGRGSLQIAEYECLSIIGLALRPLPLSETGEEALSDALRNGRERWILSELESCTWGWADSQDGGHDPTDDEQAIFERCGVLVKILDRLRDGGPAELARAVTLLGELLEKLGAQAAESAHGDGEPAGAVGTGGRAGAAAELILKHPERSIASIAKTLGVNRQRLYEWPVSKAALKRRRKDKEADTAAREERLRAPIDRPRKETPDR